MLDLNSKIDVFKTRLDVSTRYDLQTHIVVLLSLFPLFAPSLSPSLSVDSLSLIDVSTEGTHSKVISLAENTNRVSSVDLSVSLDKGQSPMTPMGTISAHVAQIQLIVLTPFVLKIVVSMLEGKSAKGTGKIGKGSS